jgi:hypothetical protein
MRAGRGCLCTHVAVSPGWLIGGIEMADDKGTLAPRSRSAPKVVAPRNNVNVALPFSKITAAEPMKLKVGDWISLSGLVISVIGFSVVIWQLIRTANASEAGRAIHRANREEADALAGRSSSPDVGGPD